MLLALLNSLQPTQKLISKQLICLFSLNIALSAFSVLTFWSDSINLPYSLQHYILPYMLAVGMLLKGPLIYLYIVSITRKSFYITPKIWLHSIPCLICFLILLLFKVDSQTLNPSYPLIHTNYNRAIINNFIWGIFKFTPILYAVAAIQKVHHYHKYINHPSIINPPGALWLYLLTGGFAINWFWSASVHFTGTFLTDKSLDAFGIADNYITLVLILITFIGNQVYAEELNIYKIKTKKPKETNKSSANKITHAMEVNKLYLDPRLNIESFSQKINIPYRDVSAILNQEFNSNFFEYVNRYRIEEAKKLLTNSQHANSTILDILIESGFNSRSAFHRFWKRIVSVSPTEYRKQAVNRE